MGNLDACERLYRACLVLFIKGKRDIMACLAKEKLDLGNAALAQAFASFEQRRRSTSANKTSKPGSGSGQWRGAVDLSAKQQAEGGERSPTHAVSQLKFRRLPTLKQRPTLGWKTKSVLAAEQAAVVEAARIAAEVLAAEEALRLLNEPEEPLHEGGEDASQGPNIVDAPLELKLTVSAPSAAAAARERKAKKKKKQAKGLNINASANNHEDTDKKDDREGEGGNKKDKIVSSRREITSKANNSSNNNNSSSNNNKDAIQRDRGQSGKAAATAVRPSSAARASKERVARASFPSEVKLTRKVASPSRK